MCMRPGRHAANRNQWQILSVAGMPVATVVDFAPNDEPGIRCMPATHEGGQRRSAVRSGARQGPGRGSVVESVLGLKVLTADSKLICGVGGQISIRTRLHRRCHDRVGVAMTPCYLAKGATRRPVQVVRGSPRTSIHSKPASCSGVPSPISPSHSHRRRGGIGVHGRDRPRPWPRLRRRRDEPRDAGSEWPCRAAPPRRPPGSMGCRQPSPPSLHLGKCIPDVLLPIAAFFGRRVGGIFRTRLATFRWRGVARASRG